MANNSLEDLYNHTPCYLFSFLPDGYLTRMNFPFLNKLGYTSEELVGSKKITDILTIGSKIFFQTHFHPLLMLHGKADEIYLSFLSKNKEEIPVLLNVQLNDQPINKEYHCGGMQIAQRDRFEKAILEAKHVAEQALYDNEELTRTKKELEHHQEQLEKRLQNLAHMNQEHQQITRVISHDLQEPIRKLSLFTDRVMEGSAEVLHPRLMEMLSKINRSSKKIRELVIKMQQYLTIQEDPFCPTEINPGKAFKEASEKAGVTTIATGIRFSVPDFPPITADYNLIVNLFYELLTNAIKFRKAGNSTLEISLTAELIEKNIYREMGNKYRYANFLRVTFTDNGKGFDQVYAPNVFALFVKADHSEEGQGIGLAYCKKIMELHRGEISVRSASGKGTTFTLLFPAYEVKG